MQKRKPGVRFFQSVLIYFSFVAGLAIGAFSQSATATLSGAVVDEQAAVVAHVTVALINADTGLTRQVTTNDAGYFAFSLLPPGRYIVKARRESFATTEVPNIVLNVNARSSIRIQLKVGPVSQAVYVIDAPATENLSASVSTVIDRQFASELPLSGRSFDSLIRLTPGTAVTVAQAWDPGQFSFNGQRPNANYVMVDGVGANVGISASSYVEQTGAGTSAPVSALGGTNSLVPVDALREFRIETSSYAPEFGRTPGGQISIVTRSGSNDFHASAFDYIRNNAFDANDWFANSLGLGQAPLRQNDFGGVLGGPISHNRTFFFASYEGLRLRLPKVVTRTAVPSISLRQNAPPSIQPLLNAFPVPNGSDLRNGLAEFSASFSNPSTVNATSIRIDHGVSSRLSLFGRYNVAPSSSTFRGGLLGVSLSMPTRGSSSTMTATFGATEVFSSRVSNDFRFNFSRVKAATSYSLDNFGRATPPTASALFPSFVNPTNAQFIFNLQNSSVWEFGPVANNFQRQINVVNNLSFGTGSHSFRVGLDYRRLFPVYDIPQYGLNVFFSSASDVLSGTAQQVNVAANKGPLHPLFTNFSAYGQDTWRIGRRLTLTYGLRWELSPPPGEANGNTPYTVIGLGNPASMTLAPKGTPLFETTYGNFAPRVGVAYQLFESPHRETILRGGFGVFYDLGTGTASSAFNIPNSPNSSRNPLSKVAFPLSADVLTPIPFSLTPPYPELIVMDPHLSLPRSFEWNAAVEQSLGRNQSVSISYVGAAGRRLLRREFVSNPNPDFSSIEVTRNTAASDYHALQFQFQRRLARGLQALASYTWSHSIDNDSFESEPFRPLTAVQLGQDRGPSDFDIRHALSAAATYKIPEPFTNRLLHSLVRSWAVDTVLRANSASPVNAIYFVSLAGTTRPDLVTGVPLYINDPGAPGGSRINGAAFSFPATNQQGTLGRNALRGFPVSQIDAALVREFTLTDRLKLQFRTEAFNVLNHPNFAPPVNRIRNPNFGRSTSILNQSLGFDAGLNPLYQIGGPRSIQLSAKLQF
jgi:hypothetical protein